MALRDRLSTIRDLAENVLERVETRWDQAMDVFHGRPVRDPYLEDPRQLPQPPGQLPPPPQGMEHAPTAEALALNEEYEQEMWPDIEEEPEPDPVQTISEGEWLVPEPGVETRVHLGQSDEGFHYYVETSHNGGDDGGPFWSKAYQTREMADDAGSLRLHEIHYPEIAQVKHEELLNRIETTLAGMGNDETFYDLHRVDDGYAVIQIEEMSPDEMEVYGAPSEKQIVWGEDLIELGEKLAEHQERSTQAVTEVRARDWWEDQRAQILDALLSVDTKREKLESLGPEPSDDAKVWLNGQGRRVEQPSVELQPVEIERPTTEERADRDEHAIGLEREEERTHETAELEL